MPLNVRPYRYDTTNVSVASVVDMYACSKKIICHRAPKLFSPTAKIPGVIRYPSSLFGFTQQFPNHTLKPRQAKKNLTKTHPPCSQPRRPRNHGPPEKQKRYRVPFHVHHVSSDKPVSPPPPCLRLCCCGRFPMLLRSLGILPLPVAAAVVHTPSTSFSFSVVVAVAAAAATAGAAAGAVAGEEPVRGGRVLLLLPAVSSLRRRTSRRTVRRTILRRAFPRTVLARTVPRTHAMAPAWAGYGTAAGGGSARHTSGYSGSMCRSCGGGGGGGRRGNGEGCSHVCVEITPPERVRVLGFEGEG